MSDERDPDRDQALPVPNDTEAIHDLVAADLAERKSFGTRKYGTPLQAHNGRDALLDAYEEALDLCVYLKQAMVEREAEREAVQEALTGALHPEFGTEWREPDGVIYKAVQEAVQAERDRLRCDCCRGVCTCGGKRIARGES